MCGRMWEDRREEGRKEEGADTALKAKNPHVNVGKIYKPLTRYISFKKVRAVCHCEAFWYALITALKQTTSA